MEEVRELGVREGAKGKSERGREGKGGLPTGLG